MKLLRFSDLVDRQIVRNRATLGRWQRNHGFPPGALIAPNTRVWTETEIAAWLSARGVECPNMAPQRAA
jgi:hypothetical protein